MTEKTETEGAPLGGWVPTRRRVSTTLRDEEGVETHVEQEEVWDEALRGWVPVSKVEMRTQDGTTFTAGYAFVRADAPR